jgi:hypothetical protein
MTYNSEGKPDRISIPMPDGTIHTFTLDIRAEGYGVSFEEGKAMADMPSLRELTSVLRSVSIRAQSGVLTQDDISAALARLSDIKGLTPEEAKAFINNARGNVLFKPMEPMTSPDKAKPGAQPSRGAAAQLFDDINGGVKKSYANLPAAAARQLALSEPSKPTTPAKAWDTAVYDAIIRGVNTGTEESYEYVRYPPGANLPPALLTRFLTVPSVKTGFLTASVLRPNTTPSVRQQNATKQKSSRTSMSLLGLNDMLAQKQRLGLIQLPLQIPRQRQRPALIQLPRQTQRQTQVQKRRLVSMQAQLFRSIVTPPAYPTYVPPIRPLPTPTRKTKPTPQPPYYPPFLMSSIGGMPNRGGNRNGLYGYGLLKHSISTNILSDVTYGVGGHPWFNARGGGAQMPRVKAFTIGNSRPQAARSTNMMPRVRAFTIGGSKPKTKSRRRT